MDTDWGLKAWYLWWKNNGGKTTKTCKYCNRPKYTKQDLHNWSAREFCVELGDKCWCGDCAHICWATNDEFCKEQGWPELYQKYYGNLK